MKNSKFLSTVEIEQIISGGCFLATGGGGGLKDADGLKEKLLTYPNAVNLVDPAEIPDEAIIPVIAGIGSPRDFQGREFVKSLTNAFDELERILGVKFTHIVPAEIGAVNTICPMLAAVAKNIPIVDGDGAGRSIPQLDMTTFTLEDVSIKKPITAVITNEAGDKLVVEGETVPLLEQQLREKLAKDHEKFANVAGLAMWAMTGKKLKEAVIWRTISLAKELGKALQQPEPLLSIQTVLDKSGMYNRVLAKGTVVDIIEETRKTFDFGTIEVREDDGTVVKIHYKNENLIVWKEGKVLAMAPDLICCIKSDGQPCTNVDIRKGDEVVYIGIECPEKLYKQAIISAFLHEINQFGLEITYTPLKELA